MTTCAYYNEIDPKAAATLRELIREGHIAPGDVDERSIEDVTPAELVGYTQRHFFAGAGIWSLALRNAGWPDDEPVVTMSCPCQPFSSAGKGAGFADERHLWPAGYWHIALGEPCPVLGEQVSSDDGLAWFDVVRADMEHKNYAIGPLDIPAAGFGSPHIRQRLYWLAVPTSSGSLSSPHGGVHRGEESGRARHAESQRHRDAMRLADTDGPGFTQREGVRGSHNTDPGSSTWSALIERRATSGMDDAQRDRRGQIGEWDHREHVGIEPASTRLAGGLADADGWNTSTERQQRRRKQRLHQNSGGARRMDDSASDRRPSEGTRAALEDGVKKSHAEGELPNGFEGRSDLSRPGPTNGFWRTADWILCRPEPGYPNGRWRPVDSGTFPLAHGYPQRVGLLRLAGNAIVEPQAREFIKAAREAIRQIQGGYL